MPKYVLWKAMSSVHSVTKEEGRDAIYMTATLYLSLLQTEQEQHENIFTCLHADVYTYIENSTNNHKNMETAPDFLTSTVVRMQCSTKNLLLTLGEMQTIK